MRFLLGTYSVVATRRLLTMKHSGKIYCSSTLDCTALVCLEHVVVFSVAQIGCFCPVHNFKTRQDCLVCTYSRMCAVCRSVVICQRN